MNVICYYRSKSEKRKPLLRYCKDNDYRVKKIIKDRCSSKNEHSMLLKSLIKQGDIDMIVVYDIASITLSPLVLCELMSDMKKHGVKLICLNEKSEHIYKALETNNAILSRLVGG